MSAAKKRAMNCKYLLKKEFCNAVTEDHEGKAIREKSCKNKSKNRCCYLCDYKKTCEISCAYFDKHEKVQSEFEGDRTFEENDQSRRIDGKDKTMIMTTTDVVPGREIAKILGVVHDAQTAWASGKNAQNKILKSLTKQAEALGADAIVGLKLQLATFGGYTGVGTAVKLKPSRNSNQREYLR